MLLNSTCPVPAGSEDYHDRGTAWKPMMTAAFGCTCATLVISLSLITLHLRRYRAPKEQRQIIRISFSVIVYAVVAFFEIYSYSAAQYIDPIGDVYEAFGLCALFLLFVQYAAPSGTFNDDLFESVKAAEEKETGFDWPRISWIFVFQYPLCLLLCVAIIEATEATGHYCTNSLDPQFAHLWVEILESVSISFCVIAILAFRGHMKGLMRMKRGLAKLLCFKIIVFIRFTQAWAFSTLLQYQVIKPSATFSYNDILWAIPGLATCAEMLLFSLGFWYAYSSTEYSSTAKPHQRPLPLWRAVLDAANPWDLFVGIVRIFPLCREVHRNGDWKRWRAAMKEGSITARVMRRYKKYKNSKRRPGQGRYQELNESMEAMNKPMESHHGHSDSAATQEEAGAYAMTGIGGQDLYQPPSGTPPEESGAYLMAQSRTGRSPSPSPEQGQWNGQRYDRTPSPPRSYGVEMTEERSRI